MNGKILIYGMGLSGKSSLDFLYKRGYDLDCLDERKSLDLDKEAYEGVNFYLGGQIPDLNEYSLLVKSPGIPPKNEIVKRARENKIKITNELELSYIFRKTDKIIGITGTNGKTTISTIVYQMIKNADKKVSLAGNIGRGILETMDKLDEDDYLVLELSSFQLAEIEKFRPMIAGISNIKEDHLDWHESIENYRQAKLSILKNQEADDLAVLNIRDFRDKIDLRSNYLFFSTEEDIESDIYIRNQDLIYRGETLFSLEGINIIRENLLLATGIGLGLGIEINIIEKTLREFKSLAHRLELVDMIRGRSFINDSKGTNPQSTIMAIESTNEPIILIAGGYDKGSDFEELFDYIEKKVQHLILFGANRDDFKKIADRRLYKSYTYVDNMEMAVNKAYELSGEGTSILLSPASASWGQYKNFEERGRDFIDKIKILKDKDKNEK